jgi:anti-sigma factor RsiW
MSDLREHLRVERLLAERPEVAARVVELREQRAYLRGRLSGVARTLRLARFADPLLRALLRRLRD